MTDMQCQHEMYRPTNISLAINLVMCYRPITENTFLKLPVRTASSLEASFANSLSPKICPNTLHRAHEQQKILSKSYGKSSQAAKL